MTYLLFVITKTYLMVGNKGGMTFYSVLVKHECVIMGICLGECAYMRGDMSSVLICRGR